MEINAFLNKIGYLTQGCSNNTTVLRIRQGDARLKDEVKTTESDTFSGLTETIIYSFN